MEEASNNANAHFDVLAESLNHHESQGGSNNLVSSHGETVISITPPTDTDFEQGYDVFNPPDISNNAQVFDGPRVSSRGRMQKLSRKLMNSIKNGFNNDWIEMYTSCLL